MEEIFEPFMGSEAKRKVLTEFLRLGIGIRDGSACIGDIALDDVKIGRALGVDRRVVRSLITAIGKDDRLGAFFHNMRSRAFLSDAGSIFGMVYIRIRADPSKAGIVASVSAELARGGVGIRQIIADDPHLFPDPCLHVIIDGPLDGKIIERLKRMREIEEITLK